MQQHWVDQLREIGKYKVSVEHIKENFYENARRYDSLQAMWQECTDASAMLWLLTWPISNYSMANLDTSYSRKVAHIDCKITQLIIQVLEVPFTDSLRVAIETMKCWIDRKKDVTWGIAAAASDLVYTAIANHSKQLDKSEVESLVQEYNKQAANLIREYFPRVPEIGLTPLVWDKPANESEQDKQPIESPKYQPVPDSHEPGKWRLTNTADKSIWGPPLDEAIAVATAKLWNGEST